MGWEFVEIVAYQLAEDHGDGTHLVIKHLALTFPASLDPCRLPNYDLAFVSSPRSSTEVLFEQVSRPIILLINKSWKLVLPA